MTWDKAAPHQGEYEVEPGVFLPRVTAILGTINKKALIGWARNTARDNTIQEAGALYATARKTTPAAFMAALRKRMTYQALTAGTDDAANIGMLVHLRVEAEMREELGERVTVPEIPQVWVDRDGVEAPHPAMLAYQSYSAWRRAHCVVPQKAEVRVISRTLGYAGTVDLFAVVDGRDVLLDYKTSKAIYPEYAVQVAAYRHAALEERHTTALLPALIVRFPKAAGDEFEVSEIAPERHEDLMSVFLAALELWTRGFGR